ncbi:hypothetical protein HK405_014610, partial [Cladochytrium tenue]
MAGGVVVYLGPRAALRGSVPPRLEELKKADIEKNPRAFLAAVRRNLVPVRTTKRASPAAHALLVRLDSLDLMRCVLTTQLDGLLHGLGLRDVVELHGSVWDPPRCARCRERAPFPDEYWTAAAAASTAAAAGPSAAASATRGAGSASDATVPLLFAAAAARARGGGVPAAVRCPRPGCVGGRLVPNVALAEDVAALEGGNAPGSLVWERNLREALDTHVAKCTALIVIGASPGDDPVLARVLSSTPASAPRLLLDSFLPSPPAAPFLSASPVASLGPADGRARALAHDAVARGENYRDVALVAAPVVGAESGKGDGDAGSETDAAVRAFLDALARVLERRREARG